MITTCKENAKKLLQPDADFSEVCYLAEIVGEYGGTADGNYVNRKRILVGILFTEDKTPYENLIRYLLIEEIKDRETHWLQGIGLALELAVFLLKPFSREEDVKLFAKAKKANFDTFAGFDADNLFFKSDVSNFAIDEAIRLAQDLEEYEYSASLIELWKNEQIEWDEKNLTQLHSYERFQKNAEGELAALLALFALKKEKANDWDFCSLAQDIAKKQLELGQMQAAFETVQQMLPRLMKVDGWQNVGLGRFIMEVCMDLVIASDKQDALQIWNHMKLHLSKMKNMHWNLYEKAANAAAKMRDNGLSKSLLDALEWEKKKLR